MKTISDTAMFKSQVQALVHVPAEDHEQADSIINEICLLYEKLAGIDGKNTATEFITNIPTEVGISLSLNHAASCITDYRRTHKLLKGMVQALQDLQQTHPQETLRVFYAGSGPLAPFMTLVAPLFAPEEVQFTLLEINKKSMAVAKELIDNLELNAYLEACYTADAITFEVPKAERYHLLFSETLDALLNREGYVPILWNLLPQFDHNITVIPENVQIKVNYKAPNGDEFPFGIAFDTRKMLNETPKTAELPERLKTVSLNLEAAEKYDSIILDTEVKVYKDWVLTRGESSISLALEVPIQKPVIHHYADFVYTIKPTPALQIGVR